MNLIFTLLFLSQDSWRGKTLQRFLNKTHPWLNARTVQRGGASEPALLYRERTNTSHKNTSLPPIFTVTSHARSHGPSFRRPPRETCRPGRRSLPRQVCSARLLNADTVLHCEWTARYFMNGADHVLPAPPRADISHITVSTSSEQHILIQQVPGTSLRRPLAAAWPPAQERHLWALRRAGSAAGQR